MEKEMFKFPVQSMRGDKTPLTVNSTNFKDSSKWRYFLSSTNYEAYKTILNLRPNSEEWDESHLVKEALESAHEWNVSGAETGKLKSVRAYQLAE